MPAGVRSSGRTPRHRRVRQSGATMQDGSDEGESGRTDETAAANGPDEEREYPVDRLRRRFASRLGERPLMVYLVLFAGAAVLLILLIIVWISAVGDGDEQPPPCFDITVDDAQTAILGGEVERVEIFLDRQRPELGPSVIRLQLKDDTCRELPKGADNIDLAYRIIGFVEVYNNTHPERVRISYRRTDILPELLVTSTPTPTPTVLPTPTETPVLTETPTLEPTATATPATPIASEVPSATPTLEPTATATATVGVASPVA
ncbi:MAG TPA: hypothetical protein VKB09_05565 [Thermomicrobiales bacterium]|nr:hypothetical protein [Thermomicrobiales bacterium]